MSLIIKKIYFDLIECQFFCYHFISGLMPYHPIQFMLYFVPLAPSTSP
jgi:hypothetical protein